MDINNFIPYQSHINYNNYGNKCFDNIRKNKDLNIIPQSFKNDLLKIFISLFYYEKSMLLNNKEYIFNDNEIYYLINIEWLKEYKEYYNYPKLYNYLKKIGNKKSMIYYHNLEKHINYIIDIFKDTDDILNYNQKLFSNNEILKASYENINNNLVFKNCYIINFKIMDLIKNHLFQSKEIYLEPKQLFYQNNNIFLIDNKSIIIGKINEELIFISEYILLYKSMEILKYELKHLLTKTIIDYIRYRKCVENNLNKQILRNKNNEDIGQLFILTYKKKMAKNYSNENISKNNKGINLIPKQNIKSLNSENNKLNNQYNKSKKKERSNDSKFKASSNDKNSKTNSINYSYNNSINNNYSKESKQSNKNNSINIETIINSKDNSMNNITKALEIIKNDNKNKNESLVKGFMKFTDKSIEKDLQKEKQLNLALNNKNRIFEEQIKNLKLNNDNLQNDLTQLKSQLEMQKKLNNEYKTKENELINLNNKYLKQINSLEQNIKQKDNEIKILKNNIENNNDEKIKEYQNVLEKKEIEIKNLMKNINDNNIQLKNKEKEELEKQIKLNNENKLLKEELNNKIKINEQIQREINELKEKNKEKDNEINMLKELNKNEEYEILLKQIQKENNDLKQRNNNIEIELSKREKDLEKQIELNKEYKSKENKLVDMNQKIEQLQKQINYLETENNQKNEKIKLLGKNNKNETDNITKKYQEALNEKDNEIKTLKQIQFNYEEMKKKNASLETGITIIKESYNSLININEINNKEKEYINENNKIDKYKNLLNENGKLRQKFSDKENELQNQIKLNNELRKENENNINIINKLKNNINELNEKIKNFEKNKNDIEVKDINLKNKENELNKRYLEVMGKEKEINRKISFLEDKENLIENENKKMKELGNDIMNNQKIMNENKDLYIKNKQLEKEVKELRLQINQILNQFNENKDYAKENLIINNDLSVSSSLDAEAIKYLIDKNKEIEKIRTPRKMKNIDIMKRFKEPTLIGLNNIGATCFMNSTLQCLSQTKALSSYFLNNKNKEKIINNNISLKNKNDNQLSPLYLELINKLWEVNGPKSFSPNNFMNMINTMNPLFKKGEAGDSKDFIIFILEQIHKELKKPVNENIDNNIIVNEPLNQYDKNNAFNHFFSEFKKECSIISDIFFGFNETNNVCLNCKNIYNSQGLPNPVCYNYGIFNCLIFPLEEVKKMKNKSLMNNYVQINNNRVSIYECFFYNQNSEYFTGDNRNFCNLCKQTFDSLYTSRIFVSPNVLVLILNRGKGNIYDVKLDFNEKLDITQFVLQKEAPQINYDLYGVITHIGQSGPNAHFVASCKSPIDNKWYRYNDALVNPINNLQKEVIDFGTPYILFYQKNNNN